MSPSVRTHRALHGSLDPRLPLQWPWWPRMPAAHLHSSGPSMLESLHVVLPVNNTVAAASAPPEQPSAGHTGSCSRHRRPESRPARRCPPCAHSVQGAEPAFSLSVRHVSCEGATMRWMWLPHRFPAPTTGSLSPPKSHESATVSCPLTWPLLPPIFGDWFWCHD